ncbi:MAG: hypothetical protein C0418_05500 [Coriobacteriaceae bacterium]|nr:hypothetical protein [Coriobacteriaceae bacterium]
MASQGAGTPRPEPDHAVTVVVWFKPSWPWSFSPVTIGRPLVIMLNADAAPAKRVGCTAGPSRVTESPSSASPTTSSPVTVRLPRVTASPVVDALRSKSERVVHVVAPKAPAGASSCPASMRHEQNAAVARRAPRFLVE